MNKRDFLKTFGTAAIGSPFLSLDLSSNHKFEDYSKRETYQLIESKQFHKNP
jgi:hypothetical protein